MHRVLRAGLLLALLFGTLHVALHGLENGALSAADDCQVCRLAHSPATGLSLLAPVLAILWLGFQLPLFPASPSPRVAGRLHWTRAPPQV